MLQSGFGANPKSSVVLPSRFSLLLASDLTSTGFSQRISMKKYLIYSAFAWLSFSGTSHFIADVLSQYLRGKRLPSSETTLYYGLNSAFALGQVAFGLLGLWIAWRALQVLTEFVPMILAIAASLAWFAIAILFMEYWEPKMTAGIFCVLLVAALCAPR